MKALRWVFLIVGFPIRLLMGTAVTIFALMLEPPSESDDLKGLADSWWHLVSGRKLT